MVKSVLFCVENGFASSKPAFEYASRVLVQEGDLVHIVTVMKPSDYVPPGTAEGPMASFSADAVVQHYEARRVEEELSAADTLKQASQFAGAMNLNLGNIEYHALNAVGGASGIAESLVKYADSKKIDLAVLGSRGGGAISRGLRSVVGLGSVSDYAVHNMHCPVLVVRDGCLEQPQVLDGQHRNICLACDETPQSKGMVQWMLNNVIKEADNVHVVSVAKPVDYTIIDPLLDSSTAVVNGDAFNSDQMEASKAESLKKAEQTARGLVGQIKSHGLPLDNVWYKALHPEGGASGISDSLMHYASSNKNNMIVVGNRDLGFLKRALTSLIGLDSVSEHLAHNAPCPVLIFKH